MADTRPAGEGSERSGEPKVPAQDQPVSELARLIAQSDAKGKGFWRRRKRKAAATTTTEPAAAPPAEPAAAPTVEPDAVAAEVAAAPSGGSTTAPASASTALAGTSASAGGATEEKVGGRSGASDEPAESADASAAGEAVESSTVEVTGAATDAEPAATGDSSAEKPAAGAVPSSDEKAVAAAESSGDEVLTAEAASGESSGEEASAAETAGEMSSEAAAATTAEETSGEEPAPEVAESATGGELSAEMVTAAELAGGDAPTGTEARMREEESRPKVGVVYEPVESAEGFPLEYGEIIIGLPKQPGADNGEPADLTQAAEAEADAVAAEVAANQQDAEATTANATTAQPVPATAGPATAGSATAVPATAGPAASGDETVGDAEAAKKDAPADTEDEDPAAADPPASPADVAAEADPNNTNTEDPPATVATDAPSPEAEHTDDHATAEATNVGDSHAEDSNAGDSNAEDPTAEDPPAAGVTDDTSPEAEHAEDSNAEDPLAGEVTDESSAEAGRAEDGASAEVASAEDPSGEESNPDDPSAVDSDAGDASGQDTDAGDKNADDAYAEGTTAEDTMAEDANVEDATAEDATAEDATARGGRVDAAAQEATAGQDAEDASAVPVPAIAGIAALGGEGDGSAGASESGAAASGGSDAGSGQGDVAAEAYSGAAGSRGEDSQEVADSDSDAHTGADSDSDAAGSGAVVAGAEEAVVDAAAEQAAMALITALMKLRGALAASQLPLDVVGADEARQQQKAMLDQLDDYILPRLVQLEAPVLAVVGGSTGAGKSTLVNSLIGQVVSEPGVLRPTTRSPVLIHHPADAEWFVGDRVLPGMARSSGDRPGGTEDPGQIRLVAADTIPPGLAILDAPDIDSVVEANRELATQLLAAADLWLFVTTAARYADAVPWEFLQSASDRSTAVAVVLDRAPADTIDDITGHLAQMLLERGLGDSPLFSIKETVVDSNGMLASEVVASIKDWLIDLAADSEARSAVVRRTLQGAVTAMTKKTPAFAKAVRAQADTVVELRSTAETAYDRAVKDIALATQDGTMLRGEVLARWQEFVGTGELLKGLQTNVGRLRDKVRTAVVGKPPPTRDLKDAVESGLESLLREHAEAAAERAEEAWQSTAPGRQLLAAGDRDMGRMSKEFPAEAARAVREWQGYVLDLVREEGADKRSTARILAYGVNGLGLALMVVIFASTAGIPTGAEVGVGAGTAVVGQKLLEAVFGDQAVRTLAAKARDDLDARVHALMDAEFARYLAVLDQHPVDPDAPRQLTEAARAVEDCT